MEMCYAGAIAMPSSYVVMNEEEMTYTEGGAQDIRYGKNLEQCMGQYGLHQLSVEIWPLN
jgi:hypothetical protein